MEDGNLEEPMIEFTIRVIPGEGLPTKDWEVEVSGGGTVSDLKDAIQQEYSVEPAVQRLCLDEDVHASGIKDHVPIADLPQIPRPFVYLRANRGKDKQLLDKVLAWAYGAEVLEEFIAAGCSYDPNTTSDMTKRGSRIVAFLGSATKGKSKPPKPRKVAAKHAANLVQDGDKVILIDSTLPVLERMPFTLACSALCAINVLVVGLEADYTCWGRPDCKPADRMATYAVDCTIALCFAIEIAFRISQLGYHEYFFGDPVTTKSWLCWKNCSDFAIVFLRVLDTFIFDQVGIDSNLKVLSCVRIIHAAQVAKLMRLNKTVRELWLIVAGLVDLFKTVMWAMILLLMILWVGGIVMVIIVGHSPDFFDYSSSDWGKSAYFDTVPKATFSLFQTMTLSQWSSVMFRPIYEVYPAMLFVIVPFLCVTTLGLLNIIVGVVVESTLTTAQSNADREAKETMKMHAKIMDSLKMVFEEADTDGGGTLSRQELKASFKKQHVRDRLKVLGIPHADLYQLFDVLDLDGTGEIPLGYFIRGCSQLKGLALASNLHRMSIDFSRYITWTDNLVSSTKNTNDQLRSLLHDMGGVDRDIIKGEHDEFDPVLGCQRERSRKKEMEKNIRSGNSVFCSCGLRLSSAAKVCRTCGMRVPDAEPEAAERRSGSKQSHQSVLSRRSSSSNLLSRSMTSALHDLGLEEAHKKHEQQRRNSLASTASKSSANRGAH